MLSEWKGDSNIIQSLISTTKKWIMVKVTNLRVGSTNMQMKLTQESKAAGDSAYVVITVIVFLGIFIIGIVVCICCLHKRKKKRKIGEAGEVIEAGDDEPEINFNQEYEGPQ